MKLSAFSLLKVALNILEYCSVIFHVLGNVSGMDNTLYVGIKLFLEAILPYRYKTGVLGRRQGFHLIENNFEVLS